MSHHEKGEKAKWGFRGFCIGKHMLQGFVVALVMNVEPRETPIWLLNMQKNIPQFGFLNIYWLRIFARFLSINFIGFLQ